MVAVARKHQAPGLHAFALDGQNFVTRGGIPELDVLVGAARSDALAVRTESDAADGVGVAGESEELVAVAKVPNLHALVLAGGGELAAVRLGHAIYLNNVTDFQLRERICVSFELGIAVGDKCDGALLGLGRCDDVPVMLAVCAHIRFSRWSLRRQEHVAPANPTHHGV